MTKKVIRNFPKHTLAEALVVPQKIQDEMGGKPFKRLLLADALGIKPSSTNFRDLLSSSYKYGLTEGTEKAPEISLTSTGADASQTKEPSKRISALRKVALTPQVFGDFYKAYNDRKLPSPDMMKKILISEYKVPSEYADECARLIIENGRFADIVRDIGGSPHVLFDLEAGAVTPSDKKEGAPGEPETPLTQKAEPPSAPPEPSTQIQARAIFLGHGRNRKPLDKLEKILKSFSIPYKVAIDEPQLGRPISKKVKETMQQCNSAILIFTRDEKFYDEDKNEIWRPSENVVHELGAASFAYEDRVVIFKEKGLNLPRNFSDIGYIEFEEDSIDAKTTELLKELIGFGLLKVIPT